MTQDFSRFEGAADTSGDQIRRNNALNTVGTLSYVLHLIVAVGALLPGGQWGPLLLLVALVIDWSKRGDAQGSWHASHFRWRIRSVLIAALLYLLTAPLWLMFVLPGWIAWLVISVWFLLRIVRGLVRMNKGLPMEIS